MRTHGKGFLQSKCNGNQRLAPANLHARSENLGNTEGACRVIHVILHRDAFLVGRSSVLTFPSNLPRTNPSWASAITSRSCIVIFSRRRRAFGEGNLVR